MNFNDFKCIYCNTKPDNIIDSDYSYEKRCICSKTMAVEHNYNTRVREIVISFELNKFLISMSDLSEIFIIYIVDKNKITVFMDLNEIPNCSDQDSMLNYIETLINFQ